MFFQAIEVYEQIGILEQFEPNSSLAEQTKGSKQSVCDKVKTGIMSRKSKWSQRWRGWGRLGASAHFQLLDCQMSK